LSLIGLNDPTHILRTLDHDPAIISGVSLALDYLGVLCDFVDVHVKKGAEFPLPP
jgi:hypothetical protein